MEFLKDIPCASQDVPVSSIPVYPGSVETPVEEKIKKAIKELSRKGKNFNAVKEFDSNGHPIFDEEGLSAWEKVMIESRINPNLGKTAKKPVEEPTPSVQENEEVAAIAETANVAIRVRSRGPAPIPEFGAMVNTIAENLKGNGVKNEMHEYYPEQYDGRFCVNRYLFLMGIILHRSGFNCALEYPGNFKRKLTGMFEMCTPNKIGPASTILFGKNLKTLEEFRSHFFMALTGIIMNLVEVVNQGGNLYFNDFKKKNFYLRHFLGKVVNAKKPSNKNLEMYEPTDLWTCFIGIVGFFSEVFKNLKPKDGRSIQEKELPKLFNRFVYIARQKGLDDIDWMSASTNVGVPLFVLHTSKMSENGICDFKLEADLTYSFNVERKKKQEQLAEFLARGEVTAQTTNWVMRRTTLNAAVELHTALSKKEFSLVTEHLPYDVIVILMMYNRARTFRAMHTFLREAGNEESVIWNKMFLDRESALKEFDRLNKRHYEYVAGCDAGVFDYDPDEEPINFSLSDYEQMEKNLQSWYDTTLYFSLQTLLIECLLDEFHEVELCDDAHNLMVDLYNLRYWSAFNYAKNMKFIERNYDFDSPFTFNHRVFKSLFKRHNLRLFELKKLKLKPLSHADVKIVLKLTDIARPIEDNEDDDGGDDSTKLRTVFITETDSEGFIRKVRYSKDGDKIHVDPTENKITFSKGGYKRRYFSGNRFAELASE